MPARWFKNYDNRKMLFWLLLAVQIGGVLVILRAGLPVYWRLLSDKGENASMQDIWLAGAVIAFMQSAYWLAFRLQDNLQFRRNALLGHALKWLGDLIYFFPAALAALVLFDHLKDVERVSYGALRVSALLAILFAVYCFKHQLESLGETMLRCNTDPKGVKL